MPHLKPGVIFAAVQIEVFLVDILTLRLCVNFRFDQLTILGGRGRVSFRVLGWGGERHEGNAQLSSANIPLSLSIGRVISCFFQGGTISHHGDGQREYSENDYWQQLLRPHVHR